MYDRKIAAILEQASEDTPVVLLTGPRQVEKSTLARRAAQTALRNRITLAGRPAAASATISRHFNLDDATTFAAISEDPRAGYRTIDRQTGR